LLDVWPEAEPLPDAVRPLLVLLPVLDEALAGVHGIWLVLDGVCDDDPVDELCAAAYPPIESAAANASALIVVMYRFMSSAPRCQIDCVARNSGDKGKQCTANAARKCSAPAG
jgi:hypothetical protein